ncbi:hypothetical protein [Actinomadura oligospora]|uniref:hypothetical protein n=1 Tax=Actinomadura oligospora TaxID=111804 RepID=UPI0012F8E55F|nr:hypothetical protein [Actinomadura oligospora]
MSEFYETWEDRKILQFRDLQVTHIALHPKLVMKLTGGVSFESTALPLKKASPAYGAPVTSFAELSQREVEGLIGARPLSWAIFDDGDHRMVFSNKWHVLLAPGADDSWELQVPGEPPLTFP